MFKLRNPFIERWKIHDEKLNSWKEEFSQRFQTLQEKTLNILPDKVNETEEKEEYSRDQSNSGEEKEINEETFKNNLKDLELGSTINQSDGFKSYFGEFRSIAGPENAKEQEESQISEEEYCEHEESHKTISPRNAFSKPPIYKKSKQSSEKNSQAHSRCEDSENESINSRGTKECEETADPVQQNLQEVEESLNGIKKIMQNNNSYVRFQDENPKMINEKIPLRQLLEWQ